MFNIYLNELRALFNLQSEPNHNTQVRGIFSDTRVSPKGDLFMALNGPNFKGYHFIEQAIQSGATIAICPSSTPKHKGIKQIFVRDTRAAYQTLASWWKKQNPQLTTIAIAGSGGKTTTKEMIAHGLKKTYNSSVVHYTPGNFNNEIGVPHTLLSLEKKHRFLIVELGIRKKNDIDLLLSIVGEYNLSIITTTLREHIGFLNNLETISDENGKLHSSLSENGQAAINIDDRYSDKYIRNLKAQNYITFSQKNTKADIYIERSQNHHGQTIKINQKYESFIPIFGQHNTLNLAASVSCLNIMGIPISEGLQSLASFSPLPGRGQILSGSQEETLIDDSYNAHPDSVKMAIDLLIEYGKGKEKILIISDMYDGGQYSQLSHQEVGDYAAKKNVDHLLCYGYWSKYTAQAFGPKARVFDSLHDLASDILPKRHKNMVILIKGSVIFNMGVLIKKFQEPASCLTNKAYSVITI